MKIPDTSTASKANADPPSTSDHPEHSVVAFGTTSSSSEPPSTSSSREDSTVAHLIEWKYSDVEEGKNHNSSSIPDAQEPAPKQKESPSSSDNDVLGAVPLPDKDITSNDIFLDNVTMDINTKENKMAMSRDDPMMKAKDNMNDDDTPGDRKNQPSSVIYDLGAPPPTTSTSKLPTKKISTAAQKLLARIPSVSHKKKRSQINDQSSADGEMRKNEGGFEDERNDARNYVIIPVEEFHAQKMRIQEVEGNYNKRIQDLEENHDRRIRYLEENRDSRIREVEEDRDSRIRDLEENRDSRIRELVQQEMQSLLSKAHEDPEGAADSEVANAADNGEQENNAPNRRRSVASTYAIFRNYSMIFGQEKETNKANLENDTFSLMMISKVWSRSWALGLVAFIFQITLGNMIAIDQASLSTDSSIFSVPFKVDPVVRVGQFFAIILCLATQSDILTSVQSVLLLSKGSDWDKVIGERGNKSTRVWIIRILLPNLLKFAQGILVTYVSFVIIVQSDDIIDLLKDFTALMVLAETDNILFLLGSFGYLGQTLLDQTTKVLVTTIPTAPTNAADTSTLLSDVPTPSVERRQRKSFCIRFLVLLCLFALMLGGWVSIVMNQINGEFFRAKYPKCNFTDAFEQAKEHFGDGICYGGPLNTLGCAFEGGDCVNFNLAFPLCKGVDLLNVEEKVGNGKCDPELNMAKCDFDGNDCPFESRYPNCPHIDLANEHFGDGVCYGGPLNTLECEFEGGDCANFNSAYPLCKGDDLVNVQNELGNGECNQTFNTAECNFDGEDCAFETRYPGCPYVDLAKERFGDGECYGGPLNSVECDFENGECVNFNLAFPLSKGDDRTDVQNRVGNGICEKIFSGADCLYDGGDCCPTDIFTDLSFGDGICNGGRASTEACDYDNGDCSEFRSSYPNCPLDELSQVEGTNDTVIGDGICTSGIYNSAECGYESGDCNCGQMGQTISMTAGETGLGFFYFISRVLSLDGMTMALGMPLNNGGGGFDYYPSGMVKILRYDNIRKMWLQIGNSIVAAEEEYFIVGATTSLSANGNRIMVAGAAGDTGTVSVYDFNVTKDDWVQVGQTIYSGPGEEEPILPISTMSTDGSKVAMFHSDVEIRVYDIISSNYTVIELGGPVELHKWSTAIFAELSFNSLDGSRLVVSGSDGATRIFRFNPAANSTSWTQIGQDFSTFSPPVISADGNRIAIASRPDSDDTLGQVGVLDYNDGNNEWISVGNPIKSISSSGSDDVYYNIEMSSNGNLLVIGLNSPECHSGQIYYLSDCTTDSVELYMYYQSIGFQPVIPNPASLYKANGNVLNLADLSKSGEIFGVDYSMDGDGSVLSISGFRTLDDLEYYYEDPDYFADLDFSYIKVYDLQELFYTRCTASEPGRLGDGTCDDRPPYNTEECRFDGGDCNDPVPVARYPNCTVIDPGKIDNNDCDDYAPYNTKDCGYDGGDCPEPVEGYPNCLIRSYLHYKIGNGWCDDSAPFNTEECGYDGGDCIEAKVEGFPECLLLPRYHDKIGNKVCNDEYNTTRCGFDGGDCIKQPVEDYPECFIFPEYHYLIGNGLCNDLDGNGRCTVPSPPNLRPAADNVMKASFSSSCNTEECGFDGGDCIKTPVEGHPDCLVFPQYHDLIGNGKCNAEYNTTECRFDGGDCIEAPVEGFPDCVILPQDHSKIGNRLCNDEYNTTECEFDGGDCIEAPVEGYPDCVILPQHHGEIGNGKCSDMLPHYTELCGFDGGDCERNPVAGYPCCFAHAPSKIGNGCCNLAYNKEECGFDGGDCRGENPKEDYGCWGLPAPRPRFPITSSPSATPSYQC